MKKLIAVLLLITTFIPSVIAAEQTPAVKRTLGPGKYIIGTQVISGAYTVVPGGRICVAYLYTQDGKVYTWLDHKKECYLEDDMYIEITSGYITLNPIVMSKAQLANPTYPKLRTAQAQAATTGYDHAQDFRIGLSNGIYTVGIDIPAGRWQIRYFDLTPRKLTVKHNYSVYQLTIYHPEHRDYQPDKLTTTYFTLELGDSVTISGGDRLGGLFFIPQR